MRRLLTTITVIGVIAAIGTLVAPTALAVPGLLEVSPKQVNFGTQPVGSLTFAEVTVTNTSPINLLVLVDAVELPDDFNFGNLAGSTCIALEGQVLAPGESCIAVVGFQPSDFFARRKQTVTLLTTARDPSSGALLQNVTVKARGKGA
jgi:hypothetical protein